MDTVPMEMKVDVVSDFICPWCFLVSSRLAEALKDLRKKYGDALIIQVKWIPHFLLNNITPGMEIDKHQMYASKFHKDEGKVQKMQEMFQNLCAAHGEKYSVEGRVGSTLKAHRLSAWTLAKKGEEAQWVLGHELFRQYHSLGQNLDSDQVLVDAAISSGQFSNKEIEDIISFLHSSDLEREVEVLAKDARKELDLMMLSGVPHVKVDIGTTKFEIPGAQDASYFFRIIDTMLQKASKM